MRNVIAILFLAACGNDGKTPVVNVDVFPADPVVVTNTITETITNTVVVEDTGVIEIDTEPVYYVADTAGVVNETNTRLEYVSGYTYTIETGDLPMDCIVATFRVPEDAGQGIIISQVDYGAHGYDENQSLWMDGVDSGGAGNDLLTWSAFSIFRNTDNLAVARGYGWEEVDPVADQWETDWASQFGCWGDHCDSRGLTLRPDFYVPPGDISLGFCAHYWWSLASYEGVGEPDASDSMTAVLGGLQWKPADTQDFTSPYIDGLLLPVSSAAFPYQAPF